MLKAIIVLMGLVAPISGALADSCPTQTLKCTLESLDANKTWRTSSQSSAIYRAPKLQCLARVSIISPDQPNVNFMAVSSTNSDVILFTLVGGAPDFSFSASGNLSKAPVVLENQVNRFTCEIE